MNNDNVILEDVYNSNAGQPLPIDEIRANIKNRFLESSSFKFGLIGITFLAICAPIALYSAVVKICVNDNVTSERDEEPVRTRVIPVRNALNGAVAINMPRN